MFRGLFSILVVAWAAASHAGAQAPVVGESYYVRRVLERQGTVCAAAPERSCTTRGRTTCMSLAFDGTAMVLAAGTSGRFALRFGAVPAPDGSLALSGATLTVDDMRVPLELRDACTANVSFDDGQLFPDRASCLAAPSDFDATCTGPTCWNDSLSSGSWAFDDGGSPLLTGDCERAIVALQARVALVTNGEYAARERTFLRFRQISARGGILFERHEDSCDAVVVDPPVASGSARANVFRTRWRTPDGGVTDQRSEYVLHPLLATATFLSLSQSWRGAGGSMGGSGFSGHHRRVGLHFGDGVVLLDQRTLYLLRSRCARAR